MELYHVTPRKNLRSIKERGLEVRRGPRAKVARESAGVFLFTSVETAEDGTMGWLGDEFSEDTVLSLLRVSLPDTVPVDQNVSWEVIVRQPIPPDWIEVVREEV